MDSSIGKRWRVLSGSDNWEGLLEPFDSDLRRYLIHYGTMIGAVYDSFISEPTSKHAGLSCYARKNLLAQTGVDKANPFKYSVTKYFYTPSTVMYAAHVAEYHVKSTREDAVLKESNWGGYVAVATNEGKAALGRRDILVVWRGTETMSEWKEDFKVSMVNAPIIFGQHNSSLVHAGFYEMYTSTNQDSLHNKKSARDQVREEVSRLLELYKDEEVSITMTGHSLGSALATLNAVDLAANPVNADVLVTAFLYASPKVGNWEFKNSFSEQKNLRALRVVNFGDVVPHVPFVGIRPGTILYYPVLYKHVGVAFDINTSKSDYVHPTRLQGLLVWHGLMIYLHGIDGFEGPHEKFNPQGYFDIPLVNKYGGMLKVEKCPVPRNWWAKMHKGMVQQDYGTWILNDYEPDEFESGWY